MLRFYMLLPFQGAPFTLFLLLPEMPLRYAPDWKILLLPLNAIFPLFFFLPKKGRDGLSHSSSQPFGMVMAGSPLGGLKRMSTASESDQSLRWENREGYLFFLGGVTLYNTPATMTAVWASRSSACRSRPVCRKSRKDISCMT